MNNRVSNMLKSAINILKIFSKVIFEYKSTNNFLKNNTEEGKHLYLCVNSK